MENAMNNGRPRPTNPRRKRRTPWQRYVRSFLPPLAILAILILFIIFAVGSVRRGNEKREQARQESIALEESKVQQQLDWEQEAAQLIAEADKYAEACLFDEALAVLDNFSGNPFDFDFLVQKREAYEKGDSTLVLWPDNSTISHLSVNMLLADPVRGFTEENGYKYNYITTTEFSNILQALYDNGFMLVDFYDIFETTANADGTTSVTPKPLYLPEGRTPILLTQTQVNYYGYMVDSDEDGVADKNGGGFANKLLVDANGDLTCEMVTADGQTVTGAYDMIPILEKFIAVNPGFSYKGARAILAMTGHEGLFGYRTGADAASVVNALKEKGYTFASGTYGNVAYGKVSLMDMKSDVASWAAEVAPILGETDILVYAKSSDISDTKEAYNSAKHDALHEAGFRYYLGICYNSTPWMKVTDNAVRQGRLMLTGSNLEEHPGMFAHLFDAKSVLDPRR